LPNAVYAAAPDYNSARTCRAPAWIRRTTPGERNPRFRVRHLRVDILVFKVMEIRTDGSKLWYTGLCDTASCGTEVYCWNVTWCHTYNCYEF